MTADAMKRFAKGARLTEKPVACDDGKRGADGSVRHPADPARTDALSGLLTKEAFFAETAAYLREAEVRDACVVCFDIDHFKLFNDLHGLERGDELLDYLGRALRERFSPDGSNPLARLAADTFALCATGVQPACIERNLIDIASELSLIHI